jgi:hypothetical protein
MQMNGDPGLLPDSVLIGLAAFVLILVIATIVITVVLARRGVAKLKNPTRGNVACKYCSHVICENVVMRGQTLTCPNCHAKVTAPFVW